MTKNNTIMMIVIGIVAAGLGFVGGMQYEKSTATTPNGMQFGSNRQFNLNRQGLPNMSNERGKNNMRPVSGEITALDDKTITIKTQDEGSKIVIISDSTKINKLSEGVTSDLVSGEQVMVIGKETDDGTVTAQIISIGGRLFGEPR